MNDDATPHAGPAKLTTASVTLSSSHPKVVAFKKRAYLFLYLFGLVTSLWVLLFASPPLMVVLATGAWALGYITEQSYRFDSLNLAALYLVQELDALKKDR